MPYATAIGLDVIRQVAPTTGDGRLPLRLNGSSRFICLVSIIGITGITGTRSATSEHLAEAIPRVRTATNLPIAIGSDCSPFKRESDTWLAVAYRDQESTSFSST